MGLRPGRAAGIFVLVAAIVAPTTVAAAQSVAEGRRQYLAADFRRAGATFDAVLASPRLTAADALEAHRYLATLWLALRNEGNARPHAEAAVALDPTVTPPDGAPPATAALFDRARAGVEHAAAIAIDSAASIEPERPARIRATLSPAPPSLAAGLRVECRSGAVHANRDGPVPTVEVDITPPADAATVACRAAALTAAGASLLEAERELDVAAPDVAPVAVEETSSGGSPWPWIAAGGGAVVVVAAVVLIVVATSGSDSAHFSSTRVEGW